MGKVRKIQTLLTKCDLAEVMQLKEFISGREKILSKIAPIGSSVIDEVIEHINEFEANTGLEIPPFEKSAKLYLGKHTVDIDFYADFSIDIITNVRVHEGKIDLTDECDIMRKQHSEDILKVDKEVDKFRYNVGLLSRSYGISQRRLIELALEERKQRFISSKERK